MGRLTNSTIWKSCCVELKQCTQKCSEPIQLPDIKEPCSLRNIRTPVRKVQKEYFIPGPCHPLCTLETAEQRCPRVWRAPTFLLLCGQLSHICPQLSYFNDPFFDSCLVFPCTIYFPVITTFVSYCAKREALRFCHSLAKLVN